IENLPNKKKNLVEDTFTNNDLGPIFSSSKSSKKQCGALDSAIRGFAT
ncbi:3824_t:CDS:2, partial [Entrophospora sp. SA101]